MGTVKKLYYMWNHSKLLSLEIQSVQEVVHLVPEFLLLWTCHDFLVLSEVDQSLELRGLGKALDAVCNTDIGIGLRGREVHNRRLQRLQKVCLGPFFASRAALALGRETRCDISWCFIPVPRYRYFS